MFGNKAPSPFPSCYLGGSGTNVWCMLGLLLQLDYHWCQSTCHALLLLTPTWEAQAALSSWAGFAVLRISHICRIPPTLFTALTSARFLGSWKISICDQSSMHKQLCQLILEGSRHNSDLFTSFWVLVGWILNSRLQCPTQLLLLCKEVIMTARIWILQVIRQQKAGILSRTW